MFLKGFHLSEETKKKISVNRVGKCLGEKNPTKRPEVRKKISLSLIGNKRWLGKKHTEKWKRKMSKLFKGRTSWWNKGKKRPPFSEEWKKKIGLSNKGKHRSEKTKKKISKSMTGKQHPNWKGGLTSLKIRIRNLFKYRQWRSDIFTRDNFTCQNCGVKGGKINADHIKSFSLILRENNIKTLEKALNCEELWNINNGRILCSKCHRNTDTFGGKSNFKGRQINKN